MEYQKIINLLDNLLYQINHLNLEQKTELKEIMNQEEHKKLLVESNLKLQC